MSLTLVVPVSPAQTYTDLHIIFKRIKINITVLKFSKSSMIDCVISSHAKAYTTDCVVWATNIYFKTRWKPVWYLGRTHFLTCGPCKNVLRGKSCVFLWQSAETSSLLTRALTLFMGWPNHLPKTQPPNMFGLSFHIVYQTGGITFLHVNYWGATISALEQQ